MARMIVNKIFPERIFISLYDTTYTHSVIVGPFIRQQRQRVSFFLRHVEHFLVYYADEGYPP